MGDIGQPLRRIFIIPPEEADPDSAPVTEPAVAPVTEPAVAPVPELVPA